MNQNTGKHKNLEEVQDTGKTPEERMARFDILPKAVRHAIAHASADYEPLQIYRRWLSHRAAGWTSAQFAELCTEYDEKARRKRELDFL